MEIKSEVIILKTPEGQWLAQVILTSNHGLYVDSDWGSFSYRWSETDEDFKKFILRLNYGYLATKIETGMRYMFGNFTKKQEASILRAAEKVLPALQEYLKNNKEVSDAKI
jgi:hypothetical protein